MPTFPLRMGVRQISSQALVLAFFVDVVSRYIDTYLHECTYETSVAPATNRPNPTHGTRQALRHPPRSQRPLLQASKLGEGKERHSLRGARADTRFGAGDRGLRAVPEPHRAVHSVDHR